MSSVLPVCKYGSGCYRKNPQHLLKFSHEPSEPSPKREPTHEPYEPSPKREPPPSTEPRPPAKKMKLQHNTVKQDIVKPKTSDEVKPKVEKTVEPKNSEAVKCNASTEVESATNNGSTPVLDHAEDIKRKFLVSMPDDFFELWKFCKEINPEKPESALSSVGVWLVGAYDVMSGRIQGAESKEYTNHWRFYYDPPEFQTVVYCGDGFHLGYWRDSPSEDPVFVASNNVTRGCKVNKAGVNIFAAINGWLMEELTRVDPFKKVSYKRIQEKLVSWCTAHAISLDTVSAAIKKRTSRCVCKSFHTVGILVPYDKKTQLGYRELPETDGDLKIMFKKIADSRTDEERRANFADLSEIMTNVDFANDEGDPGMGLELGIDLFCYGSNYLHKAALKLLTSAYTLLHREEFSQIIKCHLKNRRSGDAVSIIPDDDRVNK